MSWLNQLDTKSRLDIVNGIVLGENSEAYEKYKELKAEQRVEVCEALMNETVRRLIALGEVKNTRRR